MLGVGYRWLQWDWK